MDSRFLIAPAVALATALTGCASLPPDWGRAEVARLAREQGRALPDPAVDAAALSQRLLQAPLDADGAIQLTLLNNPEVRQQAARLGLAAAEVYEAGRLANPVLSATRLSAGSDTAGSHQLTLGIGFDFLNLLFLAAHQRNATAQFEATQLDVADAVIALAAETETAWYAAAGADALAQMREAAARAQQASATLAQRYHQAGNLSARELAQEQAAASEAALEALAARAEAVAARQSLNRLMGLSAEQNRWTLAAGLPEPLPQEDAADTLQALALDSRLDLRSLRRQAQALADAHKLVRRTRGVQGLQIGAEREREFDGAVNSGPSLALELPLFDWGRGRTARAQAALDAAEAALDARVLDVSNQVQLAAARMTAARQRAELFRTQLIPQREAIVARAQEQQNYMLIGVFELIQAKQAEYQAYAGYIGAVQDYWGARSALMRAVGRTLPSAAQAAPSRVDPAQWLQPAAADPHAGHHDHHPHHEHHGESAPAAAQPEPAPEPSHHDHH